MACLDHSYSREACVSTQRVAEEAKWVILLLATIGVALSTALIAGAFFYGVRWPGADIPLIDCLVFGALISPTDHWRH